MSSGVKTFNFIRNNATETFVNTVPSALSEALGAS